MTYSDAVIIGGGVAGLSAGIRFATAGRSVVVLERGQNGANGPGETLHPGVESLFEMLGVARKFANAASSRHVGIEVVSGQRLEFIPYGEGWRGYQIRRRDLTRLLAQRLRALGGTIKHIASSPRLSQLGDLHVVDTQVEQFSGRWLIDASGVAGWLDRRTNSRMIAASHPIWLRYGYRTTADADGEIPRLVYRGDAWFWTAPLGDGETAWVECASRRVAANGAQSKGADGTWRISPSPAGERCFRVGDAAFRVDPSAGHGVLRAIMTSTLAAHLAVSVDEGAIAENRGKEAYNNWIRHWFNADTSRLRTLQASAIRASNDPIQELDLRIFSPADELV